MMTATDDLLKGRSTILHVMQGIKTRHFLTVTLEAKQGDLGL